MSGKDVWVVASFVCKEGKEEELMQHLPVLVSAVQKEPGCIKYDCYRDTKNPRAYTFIEHWESQEDLDVHGHSDAIERWKAAAADLREPGMTVQVLADIK